MSTTKDEKKVAATALTIIGILDGVATIIGEVNRLRQQAKERGELTPEQEAELDAKMEQTFASPAWQMSGRTSKPTSSPQATG